MRTFNGLFTKACCDFKRISKSYATKKKDREVANQIRENRKKKVRKTTLKSSCISDRS
jgi:hypothetical protein